jgi:hypothetical protein
MALGGELVHSAEVLPATVKLGWICAEFVAGAFNTIHLGVRADYYRITGQRLRPLNSATPVTRSKEPSSTVPVSPRKGDVPDGIYLE